MKKVLVTLIALSLPTFALADATKGFYVQADAGHATVKQKLIMPVVRLKALVHAFLPVTISAISVLPLTIPIISLKKSILPHSMLKVNTTVPAFSAIYDFDLQAPVKPYVGARCGY